MDAIYLVGSDQVWNPSITGSLAPAYTLSFLSERYPNGKHGKIDPVGTDEIDPVKTA